MFFLQQDKKTPKISTGGGMIIYYALATVIVGGITYLVVYFIRACQVAKALENLPYD